jgi:uncharacterized repeat protein (TIGR01451 family)
MSLSASRRTALLVAAVFATTLLLLLPAQVTALMTFAQATGQPCITCHTTPTGAGGVLNAFGQRFTAIPSHETDPAGAFAQLTATTQPSPQTPQQSPISVSMAGVMGVGTASYMIEVRNSGTVDIGNVYVAGAIPSGSQFVSADATPSGATFFSSDGGSAAWLVPGTIPAGSSAGPFVFTVSIGSAQDLSSAGFTHWLQPRDATASSPVIVPQ